MRGGLQPDPGSRTLLVSAALARSRTSALTDEEDGVESQPPGPYYARKVGETQREIQRLERERRRLARVEEHAFINLELPRGEAEELELARRAADVEAAAEPHHAEILRLTVEILKLQDRLQYYKQLEALHAEGSIHGHN
jgi:hypothetical protein